MTNDRALDELDEDDEKFDSENLLQSLSFCVVDLETTGGNHEYDKIIEIGLIKIEKLEIVDELSFLINPLIPVPEFIQKLTSIRPEQLVEGPTIENVIDRVLKFMGDSILVAHNSSFDIPFLNSVLLRMKRTKLHNKTLCTNLMTKNLIPDIVNSNLPYMSKIFDIPHTRAHRALEDAKATAQLLIQYLRFFQEKNIRKVNQLYYPRKKFELDCVHFKYGQSPEMIIQKTQSVRTPLFITLKGDKGVILDLVPLKNPQEELPLIEQTLLKRPWKTITIKMVGSFVQCYMQLNHHFPKIPKGNQTALLNYLWETHIPGEKLQKNTAMDLEATLDENFLIARHLIPEQYIVYTLPPLFPKRDMIFRYPGHYQKLGQHLERHLRRNTNHKSRKDNFHEALRPFFYSYLKKIKETGDPHYFLFSGKFFKHHELDFKARLEEFVTHTKATYFYPREHI